MYKSSMPMILQVLLLAIGSIIVWVAWFVLKTNWDSVGTSLGSLILKVVISLVGVVFIVDGSRWMVSVRVDAREDYVSIEHRLFNRLTIRRIAFNRVVLNKARCKSPFYGSYEEWNVAMCGLNGESLATTRFSKSDAESFLALCRRCGVDIAGDDGTA
jgi:hypothetical protein